jgi:hypothetical protein
MTALTQVRAPCAEIAPDYMSSATDGAEKMTGDIPLLSVNDRWRVAHDQRLQWILQVRRGRQWHGRRFHVERDALLRSIRELCGPAAPATLAIIARWPRLYGRAP